MKQCMFLCWLLGVSSPLLGETPWYDTATSQPWRINSEGNVCRIEMMPPGSYVVFWLVVDSARGDELARLSVIKKPHASIFNTNDGARRFEPVLEACGLPAGITICAGLSNCHAGALRSD